MLLETPFHSRRWRNWSGYAAALSYEPGHEYEYYAVRSGAALFDVSPLRKYEVTGPEAAALMDRVVTRNVFRCEVGRVLYTPWCDEAGKLIDDGTVQRLSADTFRVTAADPCLRWFQDCALGMDAEVRDITLDLAALALQGPTSRDILIRLVTGADIAALQYFALAEGSIGTAPVTITRTGYTGDLGYEIWVRPGHALTVWDALMEEGRGHGLAPAGLDALDVARIEAGLLLKEVDYVSAWTALIESRKSSPYEAGLEWAVQPRPGRDFVGRRALEGSREGVGVGVGGDRGGLAADRGALRCRGAAAAGGGAGVARGGAGVRGREADRVRNQFDFLADSEEVRGAGDHPAGFCRARYAGGRGADRRVRAPQGAREGGEDAVLRPGAQAELSA